MKGKTAVIRQSAHMNGSGLHYSEAWLIFHSSNMRAVSGLCSMLASVYGKN